MNFTQLGINDNIIQALLENKIENPTDIQIQAIPNILSQTSDLVAVAPTGTGKTAAFCLPLLQLVDPKNTNIQVLVLVPTRELGQQVAREFFLFSKHIPRVFTESIYGGVPIEEQILKLERKTHIVVATPGRLLDLLDRNAIDLKNLNYVVLDEADEMINMGFKDDIDAILSQCNSHANKLLFTATLSADVKIIVDNFLKPNYFDIKIVADEQSNTNIEHQYLDCKSAEKLDYVKAFLSERKEQRGIMFCKTKSDAKRIAKQLAGFEVVAGALHGNLNQEMREKVMRGFAKNRIQLLVATDIAARGIDVKELDYILHFNLPENSESYLHRSGRTARAGKSGISVCFIYQEELSFLKTFESDLDIHFEEIFQKISAQNMQTKLIKIYMNLGIDQGFTKDNVSEFLVEEAGLSYADIKNVYIENNHSSFSIPQYLEIQLRLNLKGYKVSHRNVKLSKPEAV
jgi:ATP-dependent RNA helicase DeaD